MMDPDRRTLLILLAVIAVATGVRVAGLGTHSLYWDEIDTFRVIDGGPAAFVPEFHSGRDVHPPLYHLSLWTWTTMTDRTAAMARLPAAFFGIISILLLFILGRELFDRRTGLLAAGLGAVSGFHVELSRTVQMYTIAGMFVLASMVLFVRFLDRRDRRSLLLYGLVTGAMLYTHYYTASIIIVQNLYVAYRYLAEEGVSARKWVASQVVAGLVFLPWLPAPFNQVTAGRFDPVYNATMGPVDIFLAFGRGLLVALGIIAGVRAIGVARDAWRGGLTVRDRIDPRLVLLLLWLSVPLAAGIAGSMLWHHFPMKPRHVSFVLFPLLLLVARGAVNVDRRHVAVGLAVVALAGTATTMAGTYSHVAEEDWRGLTDVVRDGHEPGDLVVVCDARKKMAFDFYTRDLELRGIPFPSPHRDIVSDASVTVADLLERATRTEPRVWYVAYCTDRDGLVGGWLRDQYRTELVRHGFGRNNLSVSLFVNETRGDGRMNMTGLEITNRYLDPYINRVAQRFTTTYVTVYANPDHPNDLLYHWRR